MDGSLLGSMATVRLPGALAELTDTTALQQRLYDEFKLEQPLIRWGDCTMLRVSCHVYNQPSEYERLAAVVFELAAS
jgi:selenocysteine lyase/cysteine desulfurase